MIWGNTLKPYIRKINGWTLGQGGNINWLKTVTNAEIENEYRIFTFVRNPFDRVASWFHTLPIAKQPNMGTTLKKQIFNQYVKEEFLNSSGDINKIPSNGHLWPASIHCEYESGESFIDFIGKIEYLDKDWSRFCKQIGIPDLKIAKKQLDNYRHYYTDESIEIVSKFYKRDLELFNYEF